MKIQADDLFNLLVVLVIAGVTGASFLAKALKARKEQVALKSAGRQTGSPPRPARQPKPSVDEILQEILGEDSLRSRLSTSRADKEHARSRRKEREQQAESTEQVAEEVKTVETREKYVPRFNELKSRFDEPAEPSATVITPGKRQVQPGSMSVKMRNMSRTELQQAIVLREILGPPVSLR
jgi:hypothetical protein